MPVPTFPQAVIGESVPRALDLVATLGGSVTVCIHQPFFDGRSSLLGDLMLEVGDREAEAGAVSHSRAHNLTSLFQSQTVQRGIETTLEQIQGPLEAVESTLTKRARTHDCSIILPVDGIGIDVPLVQSMLFGSGGPVFALPGRDRALHLDAVAVAWDGSSAAARAIKDAIPVLQQARQVIVLTAGADRPAGPASVNDLGRYLRGHGITFESHRVDAAFGAVGDALQRAAMSRDCGLLILGAYGHSRLRELVLGGATRAVLANCQLPVMLSH
ncbi:MAG: universal stress protein [Devosia sp.]